MFPMVLHVERAIREIEARAGDYLHVDPVGHPEVVLCRDLVIPPGRLYSWLGDLLDDHVTHVDRLPSADVLHELRRAVGGLPLPSSLSASPRGSRLVRLK